MLYRLTADMVVICHFIFVLFAVFGGLTLLRYPRMARLHVPAVLWAAYAEFSGQICPLTHLEIWLRGKGGKMGYETGFVEHYIIPVLYPAELGRSDQIVLGILVTVLNLGIYGYVLYRIFCHNHPEHGKIFANGRENGNSTRGSQH